MVYCAICDLFDARAPEHIARACGEHSKVRIILLTLTGLPLVRPWRQPVERCTLFIPVVDGSEHRAIVSDAHNAATTTRHPTRHIITLAPGKAAIEGAHNLQAQSGKYCRLIIHDGWHTTVAPGTATVRRAYHCPVKWSAVAGHGLPGLPLIVGGPEFPSCKARLTPRFEDELTVRRLHPQLDDERCGRGERRGESFSGLHLVVADDHVEVEPVLAECGIGLAAPCRQG